MDAEKVIKALEWLIVNFPKQDNPKDDSDRLCNCINLYCQNAVDLVKWQQAEIEEHQKQDAQTLENINKVMAAFDEIKVCYMNDIKKAKTEAYKEFAERLRKEFANIFRCNYGYVNEKINKVVKELTEGSDEKDT